MPVSQSTAVQIHLYWIAYGSDRAQTLRMEGTDLLMRRERKISAFHRQRRQGIRFDAPGEATQNLAKAMPSVTLSANNQLMQAFTRAYGQVVAEDSRTLVNLRDHVMDCQAGVGLAM